MTPVSYAAPTIEVMLGQRKNKIKIQAIFLFFYIEILPGHLRSYSQHFSTFTANKWIL